MIPLAKNIKRYFSLKEAAIAVVAITLSVLVGLGVFNYLKKEVVINDNGNQIVVKTMKTTVFDVLEQNGIEVKPEDYISLTLDTQLKNSGINEINIKRAVPVTISVDGRQLQVKTYKDTIGEVLQDNAVQLSPLDKLEGKDLGDKIAESMKINIVRVSEELVSEQIPIPFEVTSRENKRMDKGTETVVREGQEGIQEKVYKVVKEDGKEVARELLEDKIAMAPVNKIIEFGTVPNFKTSRGDVVRYKKTMDVVATAYTASYECTGKTPDHPQFGITYTGVRAKRGIIAVDPKVIPLGTRVYVEVPGSAPDYGYAVAADIGSAIKGNKIDLYVDSMAEAYKWGVRKVKIYILQD